LLAIGIERDQGAAFMRATGHQGRLGGGDQRLEPIENMRGPRRDGRLRAARLDLLTGGNGGPDVRDLDSSLPDQDAGARCCRGDVEMRSQGDDLALWCFHRESFALRTRGDFEINLALVEPDLARR